TANNFNALLAGSVTNNTTIENVNVTYKAIQWPYADSYAKNKMTGLLVARWNNTAHTVRNVTLNAGALTVTNALGYELSAVTFENVKVLANEVTLIGCTTAYDNETNLTSWPTGVTYTDTYEEITVDAQVIAEAGVVTLNNDKFIVGETYSVVCGSVTKTATVSTQGVLTVTMDGISTGAVTINCSTESKLVAFTNVLSVTKVIRNAEDLNVLNAYNASGHITGYYVLGNNINCNGATYSATGRDGNKQFQGIFDGQGYTISNLSVGANGIFNLIVGGTVKNVNFTDVSLVRDGNNYTALLAGQTWGNPIIENVNVTFKTIEWTYNNVFNASAITGLLVARWSNATATVTNVVIDATGLNITNALGTEITGVVFTNVTVKGDSYELIACTGANSSSGVSDWPSGVTFTDTFTAEIVDVIAPSESSYYTFSGQDYVIKGENYSFTITQDVSGLGDFIVLVNGVEVAGNNGTYTVENVVDELTVQVIHGYIEHGSNVTVEYSASGIKLTNAVVGSYNETNAPYLAWISADYINYMVSQGYSTVSFTVQTDNNLAQQAVASYNGTIFVYHVDGTAKEFTQSLTNSATAGLYFWVQNASGSGFAIKDQGAYLLITGLTFKKADLTVTAPAQSNYYTFTGNSTVENGKTYTFSVTVKVSGLNDFIVLVNGVEVTGNSGTYTVENVTEALTIKVIHGYIEYGAVSSVSYTDGVATVTNSTSAGTEAYMAYISADYVNYLMSQGHTYIDFYIAPDGSVADQAIVACGNTIVRTPSNYTSVARVTLKADTAIKFWCQQNGSGSAIQNQGGSMTVTRG
ncbi:MAG: hypothetical protein IJW64_06215, partial [Clostridia bacterium]|nr:hypothetical protein [Clostridia bacterium]